MEGIKKDDFLGIYEMLQGKSMGIGFCDKNPDSINKEIDKRTTSDEKSEDL